jgi:imidazoleglycerol-phosphate dehydratase / histidinol-phosphatase
MQKKKALFIDRDGTMILEPPVDFQVDSLEKLEFYPGVFRHLYQIRRHLDYELVMVSNQDGMGTSSFPEDDFRLVQNKMMKAFENEGIVFDDVLIDRSFPGDNAPTRKPKTGMLQEKYMQGDYDLENSYVIGDRLTDIELAKNLGTKAILIGDAEEQEKKIKKAGFADVCVLITTSWKDIYVQVASRVRRAGVERKTKETDILVEIDLDGSGKCSVSTGLGFFDHMIEQIGRHAGFDLTVQVKGDLQVDEHHTIEDTALALGACVAKALGDKAGIERYGFALPMDDCAVQVLIDFGGRPWLEWQTEFKRERVGDMPTEMFKHFFKSFSDASGTNLFVKAEGENEHHKIEGIFKALARAIKMAIRRDAWSYELPSTKGLL